ncbi:hypothetical protein C8F04DRAFT_1102400 [Mycena alexandri]|uniref:Uncharacterized protein n=1 Tax=Mycena alexandri TaxID=1745969 RepID=A0AAD6X438_9AGAR|nr:hypothetical protein C8F04DRAFT_1102400 [Mycena alexandri]
MPSITAVLVSPGRPNRILQINSPTIRALDSADLKDFDADSSWGEIRSVQLEEQDDGTLHCTRERPATRHDNLKASGRELRRETETLQAKVAELERQRSEDRIQFIDLSLHTKRTQLEKVELVERYESIAVCLRAFNDVIFDETRTGGLTKSEKSMLKRRSVSYSMLTELITFDIEDFKETHLPLSKTSQTFIATVNKALMLLAPQELAFCKELEAQLKEVSPGRHAQQHPRLDASTVRNTVRSLIDSSHLSTLEALINSNPQRIRKDDDKDETDRSLFAAAGSLNEPHILKNEITKLEEELKKLRAGLAAQGGDADRGADP